MLEEKFLAALPETPDNCNFQRLFQTLLDLAYALFVPNSFSAPVDTMPSKVTTRMG